MHSSRPSMHSSRRVSSKVTPRKPVISTQEGIMRRLREKNRQHLLNLSGLGGRPSKSKDIV